jgi:C-terminal processing protease CtpA/Prc
MERGTPEYKVQANTAILDYMVSLINTQYYDVTGGIQFQPKEYTKWFRQWARHENALHGSTTDAYEHHALSTRQGMETFIREQLIPHLQDPYSFYQTREELRRNPIATASQREGFLGIGAFVEQPEAATTTATGMTPIASSSSSGRYGKGPMMTTNHNIDVMQLPVVTAVVPDSPAERAGITVGDRIVAVGKIPLHGKRNTKLFVRAENYLGTADLTIAKPMFGYYHYYDYHDFSKKQVDPSRTTTMAATFVSNDNQKEDPYDLLSSTRTQPVEIVTGYRTVRVKIPTMATSEAPAWSYPSQEEDPSTLRGGNAIVHYELVSSSNSIFLSDQQQQPLEPPNDSNNDKPPLSLVQTKPLQDHEIPSKKVGYIRLTQFSRSATAGFIQAIESLEKAGASSYIIDLRNNYGGVIQEAMLMASTLLRDPNLVLCYTLNSRGGLTPHAVEEFVVDSRYPGYLLSREPKSVTLKQMKLQSPELLENWSPPSSYASLREQSVTRGLHTRPGMGVHWTNNWVEESSDWNLAPSALLQLQQQASQKNIVILINEGTASSAEVFASALRDNGRVVALVGSKTYGKGLIQHTFPLPDGGGLRLTVAEYLTPSLKHVSHVGGAKYDPRTGAYVGGGIWPDIVCDSKQGIPSNIGADLCIGMGLDALEEADTTVRPLQFFSSVHGINTVNTR